MTDLVLIGTTHFTGREDIFTDKLQKELDDFVEILATLHPTKIAVELPCRHQAQLDSFYQKVNGSDFGTKTMLGSMEVYNQTVQCFSDNEIVQLGFRLAQKLGHPTVYAIDEDIAMSEDLLAKIQPYFSPDNYLQRINTLEEMATTLEEQYRVWNSPECILADHNIYIAMNKANLGNYEGTQLLLQWYERNLKIYSNLQNLAEDGDKILLIIGSSHLKILQELAQADENINLVNWT